MNAGYVGLPDWGAAGETRTGVVDLVAGNYFMFDPFAQRLGFVTVTDGGISDVEPASDATVEMTEMRFILPDAGLPTGKSRLKMANIGAIAHEFQLVAVPEGTTTDQMIEIVAHRHQLFADRGGVRRHDLTPHRHIGRRDPRHIAP